MAHAAVSGSDLVDRRDRNLAVAERMDVSLTTALLASAVTMAVPLLLAAQGELVTERAGVINIGLEGHILLGAFAAMLAAYWTGSAWVGLFAGAASGLASGALMAWIVVGRRADQVVAGMALNLLALGLTGVAYRRAFGITGQALTVPGLGIVSFPVLSDLPVIGPAFFERSVLAYAAWLLIPVIAWFLTRTLPGVRLRMVGEEPRAAALQGISVRRTRTGALLVCGLLSSLSGAHLVLAYARTFVEGMSAGRGFIALAIVILGRRHPAGIALASLLFGLATALQFHIQALGLDVPYPLLLALPHALTLLVLGVHGARAAPPAALGRSLDE